MSATLLPLPSGTWTREGKPIDVLAMWVDGEHVSALIRYPNSMASKAGRRSLLAGGWEEPEPGEEHVNEDSEAESLYAGMADGFVAAAKMLRRGTVQP